jgi:NAD+ kinase
MLQRIAFTASPSDVAQEGLAALVKRYGQCEFNKAEVIVALGGDGFMLQTLHATNEFKAPVYGMNRGTVGFLMNLYQEDGLMGRLKKSRRNPDTSTVDDRNLQ